MDGWGRSPTHPTGAWLRRKTMLMLPIPVQDLLDFDLEDAETWAARGNASAGYRELAAGLRRAESARQLGVDWVDELAQRYQELMKEYAQRYGLET
jgi:hypothetical protein